MQEEETNWTKLEAHMSAVPSLHNTSKEIIYLDKSFEVIDDRTKKKSVACTQSDSLHCAESEKLEVRDGLLNARAFFFLILWYLFSGCTLFMNKYILSYTDADPTILGKKLRFHKMSEECLSHIGPKVNITSLL